MWFTALFPYVVLSILMVRVPHCLVLEKRPCNITDNATGFSGMHFCPSCGSGRPHYLMIHVGNESCIISDLFGLLYLGRVMWFTTLFQGSDRGGLLLIILGILFNKVFVRILFFSSI